MAEDDALVAFGRFAQDAELGVVGESRREVVSRNPFGGYIGEQRNHVSGEDERLLRVMDIGHKLARRMPVGEPQFYLGAECSRSVDKMQEAGCLDRLHIFAEKRSLLQRVRVAEVLPLPATDPVSSASGRRR